METILVTGATGTVGAEVTHMLGGRGYHIRAAYRTPKKAAWLEGKADEVVRLDLSDPATFSKALEGATKVYFLSTLAENMVERDGAFIEAAAEAGIKHMVRQSGLGCSTDTGIALGRVHRAVEVEIEKSGMEWTFLRPNTFMQNFVTINGGTIKKAGVFYYPWAAAEQSLVDARDIAGVAAEVLTNPGHTGKAYDMTGPEALSGARCAEILSEVLPGVAGYEGEVRYEDIAESKARLLMIKSGTSLWVVDSLLELYELNRSGFSAGVSGDIEKVTGRKALTFKNFAGDYAEAFV